MTTISPPATMSQQHVDAVTLAGWGFNVFPCADLAKHPEGHPRAGRTIYRNGYPVIAQYAGKEPLTGRGGYKHATTDLAQVERWWRRWPSANVGARVFDGHVVIDIDPRNGGDATWRTLTAGHTLPETLTTRTGSGGRHIWYRLPYARDVRATAGEGIDLKTSTGYVIMPGSIHPKTGRMYVCEHWATPAMLPDFLTEHVYRPRRKTPVIDDPRTDGTGTGLINFVANLQAGDRHRGLYWAAARAGEDGLDLRNELLTAALTTGLPEGEARRTIDDGHQAGRDNPGKEFAA